MLSNPKGLDIDKAIKIYDESKLEMQSLTPDDRKRLRRLKRKAKLDQINKAIENSGVRMET